jgi:hypothetical protein
MGSTVHRCHHKSHIIRGVDLTEANFAQSAYYAMSYSLGCTEDDVDMKKALDKVQMCRRRGNGSSGWVRY